MSTIINLFFLLLEVSPWTSSSSSCRNQSPALLAHWSWPQRDLVKVHGDHWHQSTVPEVAFIGYGTRTYRRFWIIHIPWVFVQISYQSKYNTYMHIFAYTHNLHIYLFVMQYIIYLRIHMYYSIGLHVLYVWDEPVHVHRFSTCGCVAVCGHASLVAGLVEVCLHVQPDTAFSLVSRGKVQRVKCWQMWPSTRHTTSSVVALVALECWFQRMWSH